MQVKQFNVKYASKKNQSRIFSAKTIIYIVYAINAQASIVIV